MATQEELASYKSTEGHKDTMVLKCRMTSQMAPDHQMASQILPKHQMAYRFLPQIQILSPVWLMMLLIAMFFLSIAGLAEACSCQQQHPQDSFCQAHYVIKAKVKGMKNITIDNLSLHQYHIRISKVFKENDAFQSTKKTHIFTPADQSTCGISHLRNDTKYLLEGQIKNGMLWLDTCHSQHIQEWSQMPVRQRKGYNFMYEQNCGCQVSLCHRPKCQKKASKAGHCTWNTREDPGECFSMHSMCMQRNDTCAWSRTKLLKHCLEEVRKERWREP